MTDAGPRPGLVLAERYRLERELGRGGMGSVWRAEHLKLQSKVAIKILSSEVGLADAEARFLREARAAAQLSSPHVVQIFDYGVQDELAFLVMEQLEGETLGARLHREQRLTPEQTALIIEQIARGVGAAHAAGIVHRDLKPDNVFLVRNDHALLAKVLDFGIAKTIQELGTSLMTTNTGVAMGTIPYMSPEQIEDSKRVGFGADLWSLGVIAYECILGQRPFAAESIPSLVLEICHRPPPVPSRKGPVPAGFDAWFARMTQAKAEARFSSVTEAATRLAMVCGVETSARLSAAPTAHATLPTHVNTVPLQAAQTDAPLSSDAAHNKVRKIPTAYVAAAFGALLLVSLGSWYGLNAAQPERELTEAATADGEQLTEAATADGEQLAETAVAAPPSEAARPTSIPRASEPAVSLVATAQLSPAAATVQPSPAVSMSAAPALVTTPLSLTETVVSTAPPSKSLRRPSQKAGNTARSTAPRAAKSPLPKKKSSRPEPEPAAKADEPPLFL